MRLGKLIKFLNPYLQQPSTANDKNLILVVGKTGAGKSTTVNYLLGYSFKKAPGGHVVSADPNMQLPAKIGDDMEAITTYPATYELLDSKSNVALSDVALCDCPGFADTRGSEVRVGISLCMQSLVNQAKKISAILVVLDYRSIELDRGERLRDTALTIASILKRVPKAALLKSVLFVVNRTGEDADKAYLLEVIGKNIGFIQQKYDRAQKQEERDAYSAISKLLKLMKFSHDKIFLLNVFNDNSRDEIFSHIQSDQSISLSLDFVNADSKTTEFKALLTEKMQELVNENTEKNSLQTEIKEIEKKQHIDERVAKELDDDVSHRITASLNKPTNSFVELSTLKVKRLESQLLDIKLELTNVAIREQKIKNALVPLDTTKAVLYKHQYGTSSSCCCIADTVRFNFSGLPYLRAERSTTNGNFRVNHDLPRSGNFSGSYETDTCCDSGRADLKIYVATNQLPENKALIQSYQLELKGPEQQRMTLNGDESRVQLELEVEKLRLQNAVRDAERKQEEAAEAQEQKMYQLIQARNVTQKVIAKREEQLSTKRKRIVEIDAKILLDFTIASHIQALIPLISFAFPDLRALMKQFSKLYDELKEVYADGSENADDDYQDRSESDSPREEKKSCWSFRSFCW